MANRVFIIPRRNDLAGVGLHITDLKPNAGQKNSVYDGNHQNIYIAEPLDQAGAPVVNGISWVSGPLNTTLTADAVVDDTTGGGNDVTAMQATLFGLAAYIKDRVHGGGVALAAAGEFPFADCNTVAANILARVEAGQTLLLADINTLLAAQVADTDLDGSSGNSKSFGSVEDILRILSGEVYRVPLLTIIENAAGQFRSLAEREAIVAAQTPSQIATQGQFYASGGFLAAGDAGYRARPTIIRNTSVNLSVNDGVLNGYKGNITVLNRNFAYTAAAVTAIRPRAFDIAGNAIPATGIHPALAVYTDTGAVL